MPVTTPRKPVKLQINTAGAWKDVVRFDAADDAASATVVDAASTLGAIDPKIRFRIATDEALCLVLTRWTAEHGWKEVRHAGA